VSKEGLEGALLALHARGVYLTTDELKGRAPVVRGSASLQAGTGRLGNPLVGGAVAARTSGATGAGTAVPLNVPNIFDVGVNSGLVLAARGGLGWPKALWAVPGGSLVALLRISVLGRRPERWFTQVDPAAPGLHPRYRWSARAVRLGGLLAGMPLPAPEHVSLADPAPVVAWLEATLRSGGSAALYSHVSAVVAACRHAAERGVSLAGAHFTVGGEPLTEARRALIREVGADVLPRYVSMESGTLAEGCLAPEAADDLHFFDDLNALVQPHRPGDGTLYVTSLRPTARLVLLNASLGDQAEVSRRACGCPLEAFGWATHLRAVRSREKLTTAGMTFADTDLARVLDEVLPARFGGRPGQYQLVEEDVRGWPRLTLLADPAVGPLDEEQVKEAFLGAIGAGDGAPRVMAQVWRDAALLRVERRAPERTFGGKVLHLHQQGARET
jgi:hypothetical protein